MLLNLHDNELRTARVSADQQLLFPANPRALCQDIGLNWWAAIKLHEDGWLSFSPAKTPRLDEAQEAELRFVGSLVIAGCDRSMLAVLLGGLPRPYAYDVKRLYYDWFTRSWRLVPDPQENPESVFTDWLENLVQCGDVSTLTGIGELAHDALARVHGEAPQASFRHQA
jgi:hypothetical protein